MRRSLILSLAAVVAASSSAVWLASSASAAVACSPAWSATAVYTGGATASQNSHNYTAKWWTQNESPATHSGQWDVWTDNGACGGGTTPTTPPTTTPPTTTPPPTTPPPTTPPPTTPPPVGGLPKHALIGYLHASFLNGSGYLRMADVPADWDIINLAFGEPTSATSGDIRFTLCPASECPGVESEAEFIAAIRAKRAAGKKVLLSIGGANGQVQLTTTQARDTFVSSVSAIIDKYGLDGVDVDFEGHSLTLNTGDTDFKNPTTPVIVNLISALKTLKARYGAGFVLTMAPETFFVQLGYQYYGSGPWGGQDPRAGSYLPVIYALRNDLTVLHVQDYNSGSIMGLDNQYHSMGGADFHIAMTDMLLTGFPVAGNTAAMFPALREDQVGFGTPASVNAGNGYVAPSVVQQAVTCLVKNTNCGGYTVRSGTNPNFRGLMTWSINWDKFNSWEFRNAHEPFLNGLG
ncbi:chitinase [Actinoplanes sp. N902-109]|uniref:chitinase n=1 Tax=Actinoplanes sp. (strain N902-109) TaxID=649831 RepID=UPI000329487E|nr:glycosyl hydrolase family 18 protein [Actinoplanes sp. N902-109]AGL20694.1 glycoside hydrolase family 18 [Actinoplanes sp. N902-109]